MSFDQNWNIDKHREEHESDEHWLLRRAFMEKWKHNYPEERLVCLARVFANMEFMGCRYPTEVMQEVSKLSQEVAKTYRNDKKSKLQRTFVSASDAAEDRARGVKREGGIIKEGPPNKSSRIAFVKQGESNDTADKSDDEYEMGQNDNNKGQIDSSDKERAPIVPKSLNTAVDDYYKDLIRMNCVEVNRFRESMFDTYYGRLVLLVRPWTSKLGNLQASCQACNIPIQCSYENNSFTVTLNGHPLAHVSEGTKQECKSKAEEIVWNAIKEQAISVLFKEQWIMQGERITAGDVTARGETLGAPIDNTVATKMMKLMGWKGGGLGADAQGIAEPIKPNLQMVNRAGLGSVTSDLKQLKRSAAALMRRYLASSTLDVDLVFSAEFAKEERAALHQCAQRCGLVSKSYGSDADRFLVVSKKLNPFSLVKAVIENGGVTPKYQVFIPRAITRHNGR